MACQELVLERRATVDNRYHNVMGVKCDYSRWMGMPIEIRAAIHQHDSTHIVVNYPGYNGKMDGYNGKYKTLADFIVDRDIGAVLRTENLQFGSLKYEKSVKDNLRYIVDYALMNAFQICGKEDPKLLLMGFSAGAGAIAAVAHNYPVAKILLVAPSMDAGERSVAKGLANYHGQVYIVVGENDEVVGVRTAKQFQSLSTAAQKVELETIPNCDHQFRGERNGRILSKTPIWAFRGKVKLSSPRGGIKLYD